MFLNIPVNCEVQCLELSSTSMYHLLVRNVLPFLARLSLSEMPRNIYQLDTLHTSLPARGFFLFLGGGDTGEKVVRSKNINTGERSQSLFLVE